MRAPSPAVAAAAMCIVAGVAWMGCTAIAGIQDGELASTRGPDAAAPSDGGPDATTEARADAPSDAGGPITGKQIHYYVSLTGPAGAPVDFSTQAPSAFVPLPDGGATAYPGTGDGQGNFTINGVPPGAQYYVAVTAVGPFNGVATFVYTDLRTIDLSDWTLGRTNEAFAEAGVQTQLDLGLTGLDPWASTDHVVIGSGNLGNYTRLNSSPCADGGTTCMLAYPHYDKFQDAFLIDSTRNDDTFLLQHRVIDGGTAFYSVSGLSTKGFSIVQGQTNTLDAALATSPTTAFTAAWDHSAFDQLAGSINPSAALTGETLQILASPIPFTNGVFGFGQAPLLYDDLRTAATLGSGVENVATNLFDPFPSSWPPFVYVEVTTNANLVLPATSGLTGSLVEEGNVDCNWDSTKLPSKLEPAVGPLAQPLIANQDAFKAQTGVGTTPTLAWQAPALGTPTRYAIDFYELTVSATQQVTGSTVVGRILTQATQVTVPAGVLTAGKFYYVKFETLSESGIAPQTLLGLGSPNCGAATVSAVFAP
jgi:hypothetical protein